MKKLLLSVALLGGMVSNAQITIFEDSFETYAPFAIEGVGNWTLLDVDGLETYGIEQGVPPVSVVFPNSGDPMAYIVMNGTTSTPPLGVNWNGHTGNQSMAAMGAIPAEGMFNNDWLISPQIQLGSAGNVVKFWAKAITAAYPEKFRVGISTTGTAPADFTIISAGAFVTPTATWTEYTYNLDNYQGQNVFIGIQCISEDAFAFMVDDFMVTATTLSNESFFSQNFTFYPSPASDVLNINSKSNSSITSVQITDLNGRTVRTINTNGVANTQVNVADLSSGLYILNVVSTEGSGSVKFAKN